MAISKQINYKLSRQLYDAGVRLETGHYWVRGVDDVNAARLVDEKTLRHLPVTDHEGEALLWEIIPAPDFNELFVVFPDRFTAKMPHANQTTPAFDIEFSLRIRKAENRMIVAYRRVHAS